MNNREEEPLARRLERQLQENRAQSARLALSNQQNQAALLQLARQQVSYSGDLLARAQAVAAQAPRSQATQPGQSLANARAAPQQAAAFGQRPAHLTSFPIPAQQQPHLAAPGRAANQSQGLWGIAASLATQPTAGVVSSQQAQARPQLPGQSALPVQVAVSQGWLPSAVGGMGSESNVQVLNQPTEAELLEIERQGMAAAMADSLQEEEVRKAAELPLREWKVEDLLERFKSSAILAECEGGGADLLALPAESRNAVVDALEFERQAMKWFPGLGTEAFFREAVKKAQQEARPKVTKLRRGRSATTGTKKKKVTKKAGAAQKSAAEEKPTDIDPRAIIAAELSKQVEEAKAITFGMPSGDVPSIFKGDDAMEGSDSDVEIIEDDRPTKKRIVHDLC